MKNAYLIVVSIFLTGFAFGQSVHIHMDDDPLTAINGTTQNETVDHTQYNVYMHVTNISGSTMNWKFRRTIISESGASYTDQFCDDQICYNCDTYPTWTTSSQAITTKANGDSSIFKPIVNFTGGGTALIRYYVLDADNNDAPIDSVDINYSSVMSVDEEIDIAFTSYPNPASDDFFINFNGNDGVNFNLVVYNLVGEEVLKRNLINGTNKINVENLNSGVYFYSIVTSGEIIETKKLVVRH